MTYSFERACAATTNSLLWVLLAAAPQFIAAQSAPPLESPQAVVSQEVGFNPIVVTYYSPGVKGRKIWGELVPFGQSWRAGANNKTTVQFTEKVRVGDTELDAGTYGLYIVPHSDERWELVLNSDAEGSPNTFQSDHDVVRVEATPEKAEFRERLLFSIENFTDWPPFRADIVLHWEERRVTLPVVVLSTWEPPEL